MAKIRHLFIQKSFKSVILDNYLNHHMVVGRKILSQGFTIKADKFQIFKTTRVDVVW